VSAVAAGLAGIAWHFSTVALEIGHAVVLDAVATPIGTGAVRVSRVWGAALPGTYGLAWEGGYGTVGPVQSETADDVVRRFTPVVGVLPQALPARIDSFAFTGDPRTARGLDFSQVSIHGPIGDLGAWYVPATPGGADDRGRTWVIFVHGRGADRREALRYLPTWHAAGLPTLVVSYRNDLGAPASPDGENHFGDSEWSDVDAAVGYALSAGAEDVVLAGWSMGGALSLQVADRSEHRARIRGLILDSPVVDWRDVFVYRGHLSSLPSPLTRAAIWMVERRADVDLDRFDWVRRSADLTLPILLFASDDDTYVPDGPSKRLAAARPDLVTLVKTPGADHVRGWNVDPAGYERAMAEWLAARDLGSRAAVGASPAAG
jgi:hypothetical protein